MTSEHRGPVVAERDGLEVIACPTCGYCHLREVPTAAALERFYARVFWQEYKDGALAHFEEQKEWQAAQFGDWLSLVEAHILGRTLLDIGCGYGYFMAEASARGWQANGIEPSEEAARYAGVVCTPWTPELEVGPRRDCISALWLLEHLPEPMAFLCWCRGHVYSGGALLLAVPNDICKIGAKTSGMVKRKNWWIDKTHMSYFSAASLSNLLGRAGFRVVEQMATYDMRQYLEQGSDYTADPALGHLLHKRIETFDLELGRDKRLTMYGDMGRLGEGRDLVVVAVPDA